MKNANKFCAAVCVFMLPAARLYSLELTKADFFKNISGLPEPSAQSSGGVASKTSGPQNGKTALHPSGADMCFSGILTVKGVAFEKNAVVMPVTKYKDRTYFDVKLLSKSMYAKIQACFAKGECASQAKFAPPVIKVEEIKPLKSKTRVANADISFDGDLKVTFGIIKNASGELWAAYPPNFEVKDAALKNAIAKAVKEAYSKASAKTSK